VTLAKIHELTQAGGWTARELTGSALDCILLANETPADDGHDSALTQAMIYAQLAVASATAEAANMQAKSIYDGRI
jgi:hypothetical protein